MKPIVHTVNPFHIYQNLYNHYGPQGWWPLLLRAPESAVKTKRIFSEAGYYYHPKNYQIPRTRTELFELCLGAILTQNTSFTSVIKSLKNLYALSALSPESLIKLKTATLVKAITPSRYQNRKAEYLKTFTEFFLGLPNKNASNSDLPTLPSDFNRTDLLRIRGIGEETCDTILLYGFKQSEFVIDAYTTRIFNHLFKSARLPELKKYHNLKNWFQYNFNQELLSPLQRVRVYQEFHALIVEHGKHFYSKKINGKYGVGCFLVKV